MTSEGLWLEPRIEYLFQALRGAGVRVGVLRSHPGSFGSWYVDIGSWWRPRRVVADGKERWLIVQTYSFLQGWKDTHVWRSVDEAAWIDMVVHEIKNPSA